MIYIYLLYTLLNLVTSCHDVKLRELNYVCLVENAQDLVIAELQQVTCASIFTLYFENSCLKNLVIL